jgi:porin
VFEQKLYRVGKNVDRGIGIFARIAYSPSDRNVIDFFADGRIEFVGLSDRRPKDKFGLAAGYAYVSSRARLLTAISSRQWAQEFGILGDRRLPV